ncbi:uncharacterized protein BX664DRAFT_347357 [Halteromyces radiatus]|uniref:uncharacterized protein n=1 Tax=Halteromyces radiatus TaxID=101107 RepID=UPI00221F6AB1|nr:uncharacterized protein BX664DRAFT_347357 [Halteromyces radiatus]KAI8097372.1 hypothetical protein BX664DRAFT_347357 [Halteromyces radiatus]
MTTNSSLIKNLSLPSHSSTTITTITATSSSTSSTSSLPSSISSDILSSPTSQSAFNIPSISYDPQEKYLTFFTHSGFQNQLIQVENGILLAWYLNRTLILPRALLGEAFGWSQFAKLQLEHQLRDQDTTEDCEEFSNDMEQWKIQCPNRDRFAMLPFDSIFDLSWAKQHVKIVVREQANDAWLASTFGIYRAGGAGSNDPSRMVDEDMVEEQDYGSYVDGDILYFRGETRYDWRIFDTPRKSQRLGKYADALNIYDLRRRKEKLIHFSSLFGSGKLPIRRPEHYDFLRSLQRSITYRHPAVLGMTDLMVNKLGGHGNFIGLHIRSGDGWFVNALPENVLNIVSNINRAVQSQQRRQDTLLDSGLDEDNNINQYINHQNPSLSSTQPPITTNNGVPDLGQCVTAAKNGQTTLIYVATDARDPRMNSAFEPLWKLYPCSFTIHDIIAQEEGNSNRGGLDDDGDLETEDNDDEDAAAAAASMGWAILDRERNPSTGTSMRKFLLPLVDASISSRGWFFIGSKGSTFSGYIHRLHDVYWSTTKKNEFTASSSLADE